MRLRRENRMHLESTEGGTSIALSGSQPTAVSRTGKVFQEMAGGQRKESVAWAEIRLRRDVVIK